MYLVQRVCKRGTVVFKDFVSCPTIQDALSVQEMCIKNMVGEGYEIFSEGSNTGEVTVYKVFRDTDLSLSVASMTFSIKKDIQGDSK